VDFYVDPSVLEKHTAFILKGAVGFPEVVRSYSVTKRTKPGAVGQPELMNGDLMLPIFKSTRRCNPVNNMDIFTALRTSNLTFCKVDCS
jgi:hypothetical protein